MTDTMPVTAQRKKTDEQTENRTLELEVKDFGPIVQAKVDLRPMTVFVGPSNTGKSYLAILIYALHRFFGTYFMGRHFRRSLWFPLDWDIGDISEDSAGALLNAIFSITVDSSDEDSIVLPPLIADKLRSGFGEQADMLSSEIARCFGVDEIDALIRRGQTSRASIAIRQQIGDASHTLDHVISLNRNPVFDAMIPRKVSIPGDSETGTGMWTRLLERIQYLDPVEENAPSLKLRIQGMFSLLAHKLLPALFGPLHSPSYYLPADRTGIMHAHSAVVNALIARASSAGIRPAANTPMLSGVLADFLEQLIRIDSTEHPRRNGIRDISGSIEDKILDGSVRVNQSTLINYPRFTYRPRGWKKDLPLANASSMISELAPVVLYLRHVIKSGDILIVEEPESHLHPAIQVKCIRAFARAVKSGVRVIMITHSEWLLEELSNIVRRSQIPAEKCRDSGNNETALRPEQVGVWLFEPKQRPKGTLVKEVFPEESNLYPSGFDGVAHALYNDWADITRRIGDNS